MFIVGIKFKSKKDEILTTSNLISSAYAIELNNCKPVFIDVDKNNFQMDIDLFKKLTKRLKLS